MLINMSSEQKKAVQNPKSRSETDQKVVQYPGAEPARPPQKGLSKTHEGYWKPRIKKRTFESKGVLKEVPDWHVRLGHRGAQRWVNLETANRDTAARKARDFWLKLQAGGWSAIIAEKRGVVASPTLGEFLAAVDAHGGLNPPTFAIYASKLRTVVAGVFGIKGTAARFGHSTGGAEKWRAKVDAVRLHRLTTPALKCWQDRYLKRFAHNPAKQEKAKVSINSLLRAGRSLFAEKILRQIPHLKLPDPLPFADVVPPRVRVKRYVSKIDPTALYLQAVRELARPDEATLAAAVQAQTGKHQGAPAATTEGIMRWKLSPLWPREVARRREAFKVICLALYAGLRRDEIDTLTWRQVDFERGSIHVMTTEHGRVKSADSERVVDIDAGLVAILMEAKKEASGQFVIEAKAGAKPASTYHHYRCARLFRWVVDWLREKGIESVNALHVLRKEFGSIMTAEHGISAASRALGHANIQLTQAVYVGQKKRAAVSVPTLAA
jgi:integrase